MKRLIVTLLAGGSLAGCATTSFAPPSVNLENETYVRGSNVSWGQRCMPDERPGPVAIQPSVDGARALINNFLYMYRCRAHSAANGRQAFEVPGFLALVGATTAVAFGAGHDVAVAGGAASSILNGGKSYYDPKMKAEIYDHAIDAILCIKTEAVGIDALEIDQLDKAETELRSLLTSGSMGIAASGEDELEVSASKRYFDLIAASLFSVERVLAHRLSNVGTFDPAGVVAQIERLNQQIEGEDTGGGIGTMDAPAGEPLASAKAQETAREIGTTSAALQSTKIDLKLLRPKLEKCVLRAKM